MTMDDCNIMIIVYDDEEPFCTVNLMNCLLILLKLFQATYPVPSTSSFPICMEHSKVINVAGKASQLTRESDCGLKNLNYI